jgi:hypothetical protein
MPANADVFIGKSPAPEESHSHSGVPLQIGAAIPSPSRLDKQGDYGLSIADWLSFEVV